jgi:hypothetical protein
MAPGGSTCSRPPVFAHVTLLEDNMGSELLDISLPAMEEGLRLLDDLDAGRPVDRVAAHEELRRRLLPDRAEPLPRTYYVHVLPAWMVGDIPPTGMSPAAADRFLGVLYFVVSWVDEVLILSPLGEWFEEHKFEWLVYKSNDRGTEFFHQQALAGRLPGEDGVNALEILLLCIALGFRGDFRRLKEPALLDHVDKALQQFGARAQVAAPYLPREEGRTTPLPSCWCEGGFLSWPLGFVPWLRPRSPCPEVDTALRQAMRQLKYAGIDFQITRLFLVLGMPADGPEGFARIIQTGCREEVRWISPGQREAPFHVVASDRAVYLFFPGVRAEEGGRDSPQDEGAPPCPLVAPAADPYATIGMAAPPRGDPTWGQTLARLRRLCRLLVVARQPYAPLNGLLRWVLWPDVCGGEHTETMARRYAEAAAVIRAEVRLDYPGVQVFDMKEAPGVPELCAGFLEETLRQHEQKQGVSSGDAVCAGLREETLRHRLGFRLSGDLPGEAAIDAGLNWLVRGVIAPMLYARMRQNLSLADEDASRANRKPARLRIQLHLRRNSLKQFLLRGEAEETLRGCYFVGKDPSGKPAFAAGPLQRLHDLRNQLAWRPEALAADRRTWRQWFGLCAGALLVLGALVGLLWARG